MHTFSLSSDLRPGPSWAFTGSLVIKRNVTLTTTSRGHSLDLAFYNSIIHLGSNVKLTIQNLMLLHQKRQNPLYPGQWKETMHY